MKQINSTLLLCCSLLFSLNTLNGRKTSDECTKDIPGLQGKMQKIPRNGKVNFKENKSYNNVKDQQ